MLLDGESVRRWNRGLVGLRLFWVDVIGPGQTIFEKDGACLANGAMDGRAVAGERSARFLGTGEGLHVEGIVPNDLHQGSEHALMSADLNHIEAKGANGA